MLTCVVNPAKLTTVTDMTVRTTYRQYDIRLLYCFVLVVSGGFRRNTIEPEDESYSSVNTVIQMMPTQYGFKKYRINSQTDLC